MSCSLCNGTGWKAIVGDAGRVTRCDCWREATTTKLVGAARIPSRYQHCTVSTFVTYENEGLLRTVRACQKFADEFPTVDKGLVLIGPPGIGKSHLAVAVLKQAILTRGARGIFYDVRELLKLIRSTYNPVVKTAEMEILQPVMDADLLVLDDIGAEKTSEWVEETLNLIVNTRYNERRPTIFTSNFEEKDDRTDPDSLLVRVGFRMHSRLYEMCEFLEYDGADFRHAPPSPGSDDLLNLWKLQRRPGRLPAAATGRQAKAQLRDGKGELKWSGGRAGT
jgi:DNA replication protein DnaC